MMEMEQDDGRGGALVEEAKRLMKNDEEETAVQKESEPTGPKIKMNKIGGRKGKQPETGGKAAPGGSVVGKSEVKSQTWNKNAEKSLSAAGFSE
jgi:hypothetical protein